MYVVEKGKQVHFFFSSLVWREPSLAVPWHGDFSTSACIKISDFIRASSKDSKPKDFIIIFFNLKIRCKCLYGSIKMCCSYSISQVEGRSYLQKLVSKAKGSAPIILWTSLDDNNKKGQTPLFGNNLWMEWIQERHFAKAAKSSNITGSVPSSVQQLHSQRLLRNKDKWSLSAPEVLIFSFPFPLFPTKCEEMLSL